MLPGDGSVSALSSRIATIYPRTSRKAPHKPLSEPRRIDLNGGHHACVFRNSINKGRLCFGFSRLERGSLGSFAKALGVESSDRFARKNDRKLRR
jgi:hypothetical protein